MLLWHSFNLQAHKVLPGQGVKYSDGSPSKGSRLGYEMQKCSTEIEGNKQAGLNSLHHFLAFPRGACASTFIAC